MSLQPPNDRADADERARAPQAGDRVRVETTGRVVEVVAAGGMSGVLVELDTSGEVWLPLETVTVVEPAPVHDADPIALATHRAVRQLRDWAPPDTAG